MRMPFSIGGAASVVYIITWDIAPAVQLVHRFVM
jgi:hypothetical protein